MIDLVTCAAILAVRNEAPHMRRVLKSFIDQGIDVVVIDQESSDGTLEICKEFLGQGVLSIEHLAWHGVFDLSEQLNVKARLIKVLDHDWVIHADADEWLQSPVEGETLQKGITRLAWLGYNAIGFDEFVFLPGQDENQNFKDYEKRLLYYYFFLPYHNRLMRAWKRGCEFDNVTSGGHKLLGTGVNLAPEVFLLRHYIVLSQKQAVKKYQGLVFSDRDLKRGWHGNRLNLDAKCLRLPETRRLRKLSHWSSVDFDRTDPKQAHYWRWQ